VGPRDLQLAEGSAVVNGSRIGIARRCDGLPNSRSCSAFKSFGRDSTRIGMRRLATGLGIYREGGARFWRGGPTSIAARVTVWAAPLCTRNPK
jgi:hypothetical protein